MEDKKDIVPNLDVVNNERIEMTDEMYLALKEVEDAIAEGRCEFYNAREVMKAICNLYS